MKYGPDLMTFLKESKPSEFKENSVKALKNTHLGKLNYNLKLEIKVQEQLVEVGVGHQIKKEKSRTSLNSFQLAKQLNESVKKDEEEIIVKPSKTEDPKLLDELIVKSTNNNVEKYFKDINESDNKILQEKHKHHVQMFDKFRTSPKIKKETSKESNIASIEPVPEKQLPSVAEIQKPLTPLEIEQKIMNDKMAIELFQHEKLIIDLLNEYEKLLIRINKIGADSFQKDIIEKCKSRGKDRQSMLDNKILQKLKLFFRMNMFEKEVKSFLDEFKKMEILYKTEIAEIDNKINEKNRIIEAEKAAKIARHQKAVELFIKEVENFLKAIKNLETIYKALNSTVLNIDQNRNKFGEAFCKSIENSLKEIEKTIVDLNGILSDKAKINNQTEEYFQATLNNLKKQYEYFLNNIKNYEAKVNEQMKKLAEEAAPKSTPPQATVTTPAAPPAASTPTTSTITSSTDTTQPQSLDRLKVIASTTTKSDTIDFSKTYVMPHALENYNELMNFIKSKQREFEAIFSAGQFKTYKYELQNAINFPLNSLLEDETDANNKRNFHDKIKTLLRLFNGETCVITSTLTVNPTKHPKAIEFCMDYLARKLVEKGEKTVSSRPDTAFQYVQLAITIMKQYPAFRNILIAYFYDKCPYTVPYYKPKLTNQSIEEYFETLGYKVEEGKVEEDEYFYKRMSGTLHLYFTLLINPDYKDEVKQAWIWLSDTLNMKPRPNITAHMLAIFFKCCGYQLHKIYRQQFAKIVNLCVKNYMPHLKSIKDESQNKAFLGRLELILSDYEKNGHFNEWKK